ncbi:hypothetical protein [Paenibacillus agricola]|uniref:hypothetical protein n=1 Tax=Paenibacillus agricola TaxID=2716264 RepID=UPI00289365AC|nr:hypothetical protein [Paenibacillus agricola]
MWTEGVARLWLLLKDHQPSLYPAEEWDDLIDIRIAKLSKEGIAANQMPYVQAVQSGLHLFNESLDKSHTLSQDIHNSTGSYWHGIMHRMEGDYSNAKYWFRQVGGHPIFDTLLQEAKALYTSFDLKLISNSALQSQLHQIASSSAWDPYGFVDLVQQQVTMVQDQHAESLLMAIQRVEMKLLLQYSFEQSGGKAVEL